MDCLLYCMFISINFIIAVLAEEAYWLIWSFLSLNVSPLHSRWPVTKCCHSIPQTMVFSLLFGRFVNYSLHSLLSSMINAKLHYTDTSYGHVVQHHQRTSSQQFYNLLYNKFTTNGQKIATSQHLDMSRCWALALWCGKFVVRQVAELLWACPLVVLYNMSVASVRVVEFGSFTGWQQNAVQQI